MPAEAWMYVIRTSKHGKLHCRKSFRPQATISPSLLKSTVRSPPAETYMECCIVHHHSFHKPQHRLHFGKVLCFAFLQKLGYMQIRHLKMERCIDQTVLSVSHSITITSGKHCVTQACKNHEQDGSETSMAINRG